MTRMKLRLAEILIEIGSFLELDVAEWFQRAGWKLKGQTEEPKPAESWLSLKERLSMAFHIPGFYRGGEEPKKDTESEEEQPLSVPSDEEILEAIANLSEQDCLSTQLYDSETDTVKGFIHLPQQDTLLAEVPQPYRGTGTFYDFKAWIDVVFPERSGFEIGVIHQAATEVLKHYGQEEKEEEQQKEEGSG